MRLVGRRLIEEPRSSERPEDLVGRDMQKAAALPIPPGRPRRLEQRRGTLNIGPNEGHRPRNGAVNVALRGEVKDAIDLFRTEEPAQGLCIADIPLHEAEAGVPLQIGEALQVARIGEHIEPHHLPIRPLREKVADKVRTNEARGACNDDSHDLPPVRPRSSVVTSSAATSVAASVDTSP